MRPIRKRQHLSDCLAIVAALLGLLIGFAPSATAEDAAARAAAAFETGMKAYHDGDFETAEASFRQAAELAPDNTDYLLRLGITRSRLRDYDGAVEAYSRLLQITPGDAKALNNLANVYFRQDRYEEAGDYYRKALAIDPDYLLAVFHYGWVLRQLNRAEEAERQFEHCVELQPRDDRERMTQVDCLFFLGSLRFRAQDWQAAAELMEQVLRVNPPHAEARYYLGMAYLRLGRDEEGKQQLELHKQLLKSRRREAPIEKRDDS